MILRSSRAVVSGLTQSGRVAPLSGFIVIEIVQSVKEEGRKEGRKGLAQFPAARRKRGSGGGKGERERCSWGRVHPS